MYTDLRIVRALALLVPLWLAMAGMSLSQSPVQLAAGDTIKFSILGAPHLEHDATISVDGTVFLPLAGEISAANLTINELRGKVYDVLRDRAYRVIGAGGEDVWRRLQDDELFLDIREYRPVYVSGDVRSPGEVRFRPGLSVRQAVAAVGGIGRPIEEISDDEVLRLMIERSLLLGRIKIQVADLERYNSDLAQVQSRLASEGSPDTKPTKDRGDKNSASKINQIARRWLEARANLRDLAETENSIVLDRMAQRLEVLEALEDAGEQNLSFAEEELERVNMLAERGVVPTSRITEAQSSLLQASTRTLGTSGEVLRLRLDMTRFAEEAQANLTAEKVRLLDQVLNGTSRLDELKRQLEALNTKLALQGAGSAQEQGTTVEMMLFRAEDDSIGLLAKPGMILFPGDVLEIKLSFPEPGTAVWR